MSRTDLKLVVPLEQAHEDALLHKCRLALLTSNDKLYQRMQPATVWLDPMSLDRQPFLPRHERESNRVGEVDQLLSTRRQV
jgi:hypothetical protein